MRIDRVLWVFCVLAVMTPGPTAANQNVELPEINTITILQLNDLYQTMPVDRGKRGGIARVATLVNKVRSQTKNSLFLLAGDFLAPSVSSQQFKGAQMIAALNAAKLDIATLGHHEFDFGPDVLRRRMKESQFTYTVANVIDKETNQPFGGAKLYVLRNFNGLSVAIFGLTLVETATLSAPGPSVRFDDPIVVGSQLSRQLRSQGADVVIALTHLPMGEDKRLAAASDIDLIVGGHEHELLESFAGHALIIKPGSDARNLGRIDLNLLRKKTTKSGYQLVSIDWALIPVTDIIEENPNVAGVVADYEKRLDAKLDEPIGRTSVALDARAAALRGKETSLGNFIADCYRESLRADIALVPGGSIRSDVAYFPGELTKKTILTILPFESVLVKVELTGTHIKQLLENGVSVVGEVDGRFPQVSGLRFSYDPGQPAGSRVTGIEIAGSPVDPKRKYTMATIDYVLGGGDGYDLRAAEVLVGPAAGPAGSDVVMETIKKKGTISPKVEGRINISK